MKSDICFFFGIHVLCFQTIIGIENILQTCENYTFHQVENAYLPDVFFQKLKPFGRLMCVKECNVTVNCKSVNFKQSEKECQFNVFRNSTKNKLITDHAWTYIDLYKKSTESLTVDIISNSTNDKCLYLKHNKIKCSKTRCDSKIFVEDVGYAVTNVSVGLSANVPCRNKSDGYSFVGHQEFVCMANGKWKLVEQTCKESIKVYNMTSSWNDANNTCTADNATLLVIFNETFYNAIIDAIGTNSKNISHRNISDLNIQVNNACGVQTGEFWIGVSKLQVQGIFKWVNGDSFSAWQNSVAVVDGYSCGIIITSAECGVFVTVSSDIIFNDRNCQITLPFICMKS